MHPEMAIVILTFSENFATKFTFVSFEITACKFLSSHMMSHHVCFQRCGHLESLATLMTYVFRYIHVHRLMIAQMSWTVKPFTASVTHELFKFTVDQFMIPKSVSEPECQSTRCAFKWPLSCMYSLVVFHLLLGSECLPALVTNKWLLLGVCQVVRVTVAPFDETFMTDVTFERFVLQVCLSMPP